MNIFYLHKDSKIAGQIHCDKHVVKMILEYGQILSTTYRLRHQYTKENGMTKFIPLSDKFDKLYKMAFVNHPSTIWARQSLQHYTWLYELFCTLCDEYTCDDTVQAYRNYYLGAKRSFLDYTRREKPEWI